MWPSALGEADVYSGALGGRSSYEASTCHGSLHRPAAVVARGLGIYRPPTYEARPVFLGRLGRGGATGNAACRFMAQAPHYLQDSENPAAIQTLVTYVPACST